MLKILICDPCYNNNDGLGFFVFGSLGYDYNIMIIPTILTFCQSI